MEYITNNFYNISLVSKCYNYSLTSNDKYLRGLTKHIQKNILLFHELDEEVKYLIADRLSNIHLEHTYKYIKEIRSYHSFCQNYRVFTSLLPKIDRTKLIEINNLKVKSFIRLKSYFNLKWQEVVLILTKASDDKNTRLINHISKRYGIKMVLDSLTHRVERLENFRSSYMQSNNTL